MNPVLLHTCPVNANSNCLGRPIVAVTKKYNDTVRHMVGEDG